MSPTLRLCSRTREYRRLAAPWTASTPSTAWVVEVGCHEGGDSEIIRRFEGNQKLSCFGCRYHKKEHSQTTLKNSNCVSRWCFVKWYCNSNVEIDTFNNHSTIVACQVSPATSWRSETRAVCWRWTGAVTPCRWRKDAFLHCTLACWMHPVRAWQILGAELKGDRVIAFEGWRLIWLNSAKGIWKLMGKEVVGASFCNNSKLQTLTTRDEEEKRSTKTERASHDERMKEKRCTAEIFSNSLHHRI